MRSFGNILAVSETVIVKFNIATIKFNHHIMDVRTKKQ